ncbi:MAG: hypothetical protein RMJ52_12305, partial [Gemmataceae bacterium]|nr:hypothetical protein [Gemmataceae bacterium]
MLRHLLQRLWNDDFGAIISVEFLFLVTILGIGLITGWVTLRNSINAEFEELAAAIGILSQGYSFGGQLISLALEGAQTDG